MASSNTKDTKAFLPIQNYIYLYHTGTFIVLPVFPETVNDTNQANFAQSTPIARSAPIYSFTGSGPRSISFSFNLHRDLMNMVNVDSTVKVEDGDDYVDTLIKNLQACVVPSYSAVAKMVDPPMIAVRIGSDIFIKGVVNGPITLSYSGALIGKKSSGIEESSDSFRYSIVSIALSVSEVDPFSAESVIEMGSFRGVTSTISRLDNMRNRPEVS